MEYALFTFLFSGAIIAIIAVVTIYVIYTIALWKLFKKAGKNGLEAIIPFYNIYTLTEVAGLNWWFFLIAISVSILSILKIEGLSIITNLASTFTYFCIFWNLAKKMKINTMPTALLGALFNYIMIIIFGFSDKYVYDKNIEVNPTGPINDNTNNSSEKYCLGCGVKLKKNAKFCENCGKKVD